MSKLELSSSGSPQSDSLDDPLLAVTLIEVSVAEQVMRAYTDEGSLVHEFAVATASNGVGQRNGSECTPLGQHRIRAKIGGNQCANTVFIGRRPSGEVYSEALALVHPKRDWILTRILWLCGNETGFNRGGSVDTQRRYVYIHGAPDSHAMGVPSSHGCIKMRSSDIIQLFEHVLVGTTVTILE